MPQASTREYDNEDALPLCDTPISLEALELRRWRRSFTIRLAGVAELADALDSKSSDRKIVWVRAPPPAVVPAQQFEKHRPALGAATGVKCAPLPSIEGKAAKSRDRNRRPIFYALQLATRKVPRKIAA